MAGLTVSLTLSDGRHTQQIHDARLRLIEKGTATVVSNAEKYIGEYVSDGIKPVRDGLGR